MIRTVSWPATAGVLFSLLLADAGCGARSSLPLGIGELDGGGGAGGAGPDAGACDPTTFGPMVVDQVDSPGSVQDVEHGQLVWNGTRFGALWLENRNGRKELVFAILDPTAGSTVVKTTIGGFDDHVQTAHMAWNGDAFVVYWVEEDGLLHRRTIDGSGEPLTAIEIVRMPGQYTYLTAVLPVGPGAGEGLHWNEQSGAGSGLVPFFALVSGGGEIVLGPSKLAIENQGLGLRVFGAVREGGRSRVAWLRQTSAEIDTAWLGAFDDQGNAVSEPELLHEADTIHLAYSGPPIVALDNGGAALGFWDVEAGAGVARTVEGTVETSVLPKGTDRPVLARAVDGALGVAVAHGESPGQPPPDLFLEIVRESGQIEAPILVNGNSGPGSCVEAYTVEASGNSFGVLWLEGCASSGRSLYFSVLRRCPS